MSRITNWSQFGRNGAILEDDSTLTPQERSKKALAKMQYCRIQINKNFEFYQDLSMKLMFQERNDLPFKTMATDGLNIYYDPNFVLEKTVGEIQWVILHELMHCILLHFSRKMPDPKTWNAACDYALNYLIDPATQKDPEESKKYAGLKIPDGALRMQDLQKQFPQIKLGMRAEDIYQFLIENSVTLPPEEGWNYGGVLPVPMKKASGSSGSGGSSSSGKKIKIGDFIKSKSGQYGKVIGIDGSTGDIEIDPMTETQMKDELTKISGKKLIKLY